MKLLLPALVLAAAIGCGGTSVPSLAIGAALPEVTLPGVDGRAHSLREYAASPVLAVVFTCNHCPASQLYEARLKQIDEDYRGRGVTLVAINPDNPTSVAMKDLGYTDVGDSLADMKVRAAHRHLTYPYLYDGDTQSAATAFRVAVTPQVFVFDQTRTLRYQGRIDDNQQASLVKTRDARNAIDALIAGKPVPVAETRVAGCPLAPKPTSTAVDPELAKMDAEPVTLDMAGADRLKALRRNGTGKLLLVNFWATWCGPCAAEFPDLVTTYRMYRNRPFEFISVSENDPGEKPGVIEFLKQHHASSPNLLFATADIYAMQEAFDPKMGAAVPFTLLIAPNGDVLYQEEGALDMLKLRRAILANLPDDPAYAGHAAYWSGN